MLAYFCQSSVNCRKEQPHGLTQRGHDFRCAHDEQQLIVQLDQQLVGASLAKREPTEVLARPSHLAVRRDHPHKDVAAFDHAPEGSESLTGSTHEAMMPATRPRCRSSVVQQGYRLL